MSDHTKVCPVCGACPGVVDPKQPTFCEDCGDRLVTRAELPRDIWKDPFVRELLKSRRADDIAVCRCPECHQFGYWNEGATFSCRFCDLTFYVVEDDDGHSEGLPTVSADEVIQLSDTVTECGEGYHNHTL